MAQIVQALARGQELIEAAAKAREQAYAPYSHFRVGAAVLAKSGKVFTGCNVENLSYGLSVCAERAAIFAAAAAGERELAAVAVVTGGAPVFPCGACLQVIKEFAGDEPPIIIAANTDGAYQVKSLSECLPCPFTKFEADS